jgi:hypothetical protein
MHIALLFFFALSIVFPATSFSQQPPPVITIMTPSAGATVPNGRLLVTGTVQAAGADFGVTVNGVRAAVQNDAFAVMVFVSPDVTNLTAVVAASIGGTASYITNISVAAGPPADDLIPSPASGVTPSTVMFSLRATAETSQVSLDADSDGIVDFIGATLDRLPFTYTQPGVYIATATAHNTQGVQRTAHAVIEVLDPSQLDNLLRSRWTAIKTGLSAGNTSQALNQILTDRRAEYSTLFTELGAAVTDLGNDMPAIEPVYLEANHAKYRLRREQTVGGTVRTITYYVYFAVDSDGVWRLDSF